MNSGDEGPGSSLEFLPLTAQDIHGQAEFDATHPPQPCVFPSALRFDDWHAARTASIEYNGSTELAKILKANRKIAGDQKTSLKVEVELPDKFTSETSQRSCQKFIEEILDYFEVAQIHSTSMKVIKLKAALGKDHKAWVDNYVKSIAGGDYDNLDMQLMLDSFKVLNSNEGRSKSSGKALRQLKQHMPTLTGLRGYDLEFERLSIDYGKSVENKVDWEGWLRDLWIQNLHPDYNKLFNKRITAAEQEKLTHVEIHSTMIKLVNREMKEKEKGTLGKRKQPEDGYNGGDELQAMSDKDIECWHCGKKGHKAVDCYARLAGKPPSTSAGKQKSRTRGGKNRTPKKKQGAIAKGDKVTLAQAKKIAKDAVAAAAHSAPITKAKKNLAVEKKLKKRE